MKKIPAARLIPAGMVLIGGAAKLPGLGIFVKERVKLATEMFE